MGPSLDHHDTGTQASDTIERIVRAVGSAGHDPLLRAACRAVKQVSQHSKWAEIPSSAQLAIRIIHSIYGKAGHGLVWVGRPPWMTTSVLEALRRESDSRAHDSYSVPGGFHRWTYAGRRGEELARAGDIRRFVERVVGAPLGATRANYNYYDNPGDTAEPHIDEPEFGVNALCMLRHEHAGHPMSGLWLYPMGEDPIHVPLRPGDLVIFHARSTVHERAPVGPNERVRIFSIGFQQSATSGD